MPLSRARADQGVAPGDKPASQPACRPHLYERQKCPSSLFSLQLGLECKPQPNLLHCLQLKGQIAG